MTKNDIKIKQVCAIFLAFLPLSKIITAPAQFAALTGEKLWQPLIVLFTADFLLMFLIYAIYKINENQTFYSILKNGYGETFAKIVYFVYAIFFMFKAYVPLLEHKNLIERSFYEVLPVSPVFYPFFLVSFYISLKGLKVLGRAAEFSIFITWTGLFLVFYLAVSGGDWANLLPLFYGSTKSTAICSLNGLLWFNDAIYLIFFLGHFSGEKKPFLKIILSYAVPAVSVIFFYCCFYAVFSYVAPTQSFAVGSVGIFSVALENVGRFDYLAVFLIAAVNIYSVTLPIVVSVKCFERAFSLKSALIPAIAVNALLFVIIIFFSQKYNQTVEFSYKYITPFFLFCGYILPFIALKRTKKPNFEQNDMQNTKLLDNLKKVRQAEGLK